MMRRKVYNDVTHKKIADSLNNIRINIKNLSRIFSKRVLLKFTIISFINLLQINKAIQKIHIKNIIINNKVLYYHQENIQIKREVYNDKTYEIIADSLNNIGIIYEFIIV